MLKQEELKSTSGEQVDFRNSTLKKSVKTKTVEQDDLKKMTAEQKDFRSNLKPLAAKSPSPEKESTPPKEASPPGEKTPPKSPTPEKEPTPPPAPKEPTPEPVKEKETEARKSSQIAPRKRKPKITNFPDDIIECAVDASFEISLEVQSNQSSSDSNFISLGRKCGTSDLVNWR